MPKRHSITRATAPIMRMAAILLALTIAPSGANAAALVHLQWKSLPSLVGKTVKIAMPGGTAIMGKAVGVEPDALLVEVKRTSDAKAYPKGVTRVPRATLHRFEMRTKGKAFRIVGTMLGSFIGLVGGAMAAWGSRGNRASAAVIGIWSGGTVGGYFLGNALDKDWKPVEIVQ